jgi:sirohydrochlorin ferrochelatase
MSSRRAEADGGTDPDFDWTTPIETPLPVELTGALDGHDTVAEILIARALEVSETPADEVVVVVAHGPSSEEDNDLWLGNMSVLVKRMRAVASFSRIDHLTVRDDAPDEVQAKATQELRSVVERGAQEGKSVLIVPLLLSYGGIEKGIRERIEGLDYRMAAQGLLPDDRLAGWVLAQAGGR